MNRVMCIAFCAPLLLAAEAPVDLAAAFGSREAVLDMSLSPDGSKVAYIVPRDGQGSAVLVQDVADDKKMQLAAFADGDPNRLTGCNWVSNARLVCAVYGIVNNGGVLLPFTRMVAMDTDGGNYQLLSTRENGNSYGYHLNGGNIVDWLPDTNGSVLISRTHLADDRTGSRIGSDRSGMGLDQIDTMTLATKPIEAPDKSVIGYVTDGHGVVRIAGFREVAGASGYDSGVINYSYRLPGKREWQKLSAYDGNAETGFIPYAVDRDRNLAYGMKKTDGRQALYSVALDGSLREELIYERPDVDVDELIQIGRRNRVIGISYATHIRQPVFFDPEMKKVADSLTKALPNQPLVRIVDSSVDESKLLIHAGSDSDPGVYYILDRETREMKTFLVKRPTLEGVALAKMTPINYPAADGTMIPGYLTLPPGKESAKGLPAIVMPHGGPSARDEWGFDWLAQYFALRGYAVLQPNFRGSAGYGDAWFQQNGFQSWKVAIGDVLDAGRWLVRQGVADPAKLGIVGWSYGGYAALQSTVVDPGLFKAVVAIAPVTDLNLLKEQYRNWSNYQVVSRFVGDGAHLREGSPAQNAAAIKAPVLLFHGGFDRNVDLRHSKLMADRLKDAGAEPELVTWPKLDHYLEDSAARTEMLRKSDAFLRASMGM